jgi:hypothetical protein
MSHYTLLTEPPTSQTGYLIPLSPNGDTSATNARFLVRKLWNGPVYGIPLFDELNQQILKTMIQRCINMGDQFLFFPDDPAPELDIISE